MKFDVDSFSNVMFEKKYKDKKERHGYQERNGFEEPESEEKEYKNEEGFEEKTDHLDKFLKHMKEGQLKDAKKCMKEYMMEMIADAKKME